MATAQPVRLFDDNFLRVLPAPLREPRRAWLAIPIAWALSFLGSIVLAGLVQWALPEAKSVEIPKLPAWLIITGFAIFSPVRIDPDGIGPQADDALADAGNRHPG